ncbi:hypothetical protein DCAR_0625707 [Daucus carota subsp. sativus]|uniref:Uncharacterized protein n=1 Tax=Daucus carota subsp. sativus TaxID=79200 RepID=A0A164WML4_DAUCS|nr:PREDICTED: early nodulin-75-like [Daucus carota subsp. sativus]WOH06282.1 hypothetical protein DCAR_0625707 [Daucus carota subsp. sativus]
MEKSVAFLFTVLLLHSYVLSTAASGRKLLEEKMVVARRLNAVNMKDYDPAEANPKHDPSRNPDFDHPTDPHDQPPHQADPPRPADPPHQADPLRDTQPPHESTDPPRVAQPPHESAPFNDRSSILHHPHHQRHPKPMQTQAPVLNIPVPATINTGSQP